MCFCLVWRKVAVAFTQPVIKRLQNVFALVAKRVKYFLRSVKFIAQQLSRSRQTIRQKDLLPPKIEPRIVLRECLPIFASGEKSFVQFW